MRMPLEESQFLVRRHSVHEAIDGGPDEGLLIQLQHDWMISLTGGSVFGARRVADQSR